MQWERTSLLPRHHTYALIHTVLVKHTHAPLTPPPPPPHLHVLHGRLPQLCGAHPQLLAAWQAECGNPEVTFADWRCLTGIRTSTIERPELLGDEGQPRERQVLLAGPSALRAPQALLD